MSKVLSGTRELSHRMRNPSLHPLVSGYACYYCCIPSSPVLLHIYCTCFSTFWHCYPYILHRDTRSGGGGGGRAGAGLAAPQSTE